MTKKVLVCGGAGYIGSHMVRLLTALDHPVTVFDNLSTGHREAVPASAELVEGDIRDSSQLDPLLSGHQFDCVMHFCAASLVGESVADPYKYYDNNVSGSLSLLQAMRRHGVEQIVFSSTAATYGIPRSDTIDEGHPTAPINPYGNSKLAGERGAQAAFADAPGLWIVRTSWLYGPPGGDFPDKIVAAADRCDPATALPVVADEYGAPTYSRDLAAAVLRLVDVSDGGVFHVVGGGHTSRFGWAERVLAQRRPGRELRAISASEFERASVPPRWGVLDTSRAAALLDGGLPPWQAALDRYLQAGRS